MSYRGEKKDRDLTSHDFKDLSAEWTEHREVAQLTAWKLHKELYQIKGAYQHVKRKFFKGYSSVKEDVHELTSKPIIEPKDRMYNVDGGASIPMMGSTSHTPREKKTIRKTMSYLEIQTASGIVRSTKEANDHIQELVIYLEFSFGIVVVSTMR